MKKAYAFVAGALAMMAIIIWWLGPEPYPPPGFGDGHLAFTKIQHRFANRPGVNDEEAERAIDYLVEHDTVSDPENRYRRRQAAVVIARYARFTSLTADGIEPPLAKNSMIRLVGKATADAIAGEAFRAFDGDPPETDEQQQAQAEFAQNEVNNMMPLVTLGIAGCSAQGFATHSAVDNDSKVITISKTFKIKRSVSLVAKTFEPQRWAACSKFFQQSYIANKDNNGIPLATTYDSCAAQLDPDTSDEPKDSAYHDILYEYFDAASQDAMFFKNLLLVETTELKDEGHRVRFSLHESMCSRVAGEPYKQTGGMEVNWGEITVSPSTDPEYVTQLDLKKHVRLGLRENCWLGDCMSPDELRDWSKSMLETGMDEAWFQACCIVND